MATRLSDSEFAERARAGNRQRALQRRTRLSRSGYQQLLVWMPGDLRNQIDRIAADRGTSVNDATTIIVRAGIAALTYRPVSEPLIASLPTTPESLPLFEPVPTEPAPPLTCVNADQHSLVEGGSIKAEPAHAEPGTLAERDAAIMALHRQGKSQREIARQLAAQGIVTATGNPLSVGTIQKAIKRAD